MRSVPAALGDAANNAHLVEQLRGVDDRRAYLLRAGAGAPSGRPEPLIAEGRWLGEIVDTPRGERLRLRPVFLRAGARRDGRRARAAVKNTHSHRALALDALLARLAEETA
jgi:XTP/dITP diphosphohydrolase